MLRLGELDGQAQPPEDLLTLLEEELIRSEELRALWHAFSGLSENCQRLLRVLFADPPPQYGEISAALGMPVGSIGPTRARCLASLQSHLSRTAAHRQRGVNR